MGMNNGDLETVFEEANKAFLRKILCCLKQKYRRGLYVEL